MVLDEARLSRFSDLARIVAAQLDSWPEHARFFAARFNEEDDAALTSSNEVARLVLLLTGADLPRYCADYRWMCENFIEEELYFRRHKRYRLSTFAEAFREVYDNRPYMSRYVNGILLSQLFWHNHAAALNLFRTRFLPSLPEGYHHLEVGPGHGLFLSYAAADERCGSATGWDVSEASIHSTQAALDKFGIARPVTLVLQDILTPTPSDRLYDTAIISEVLEHLENPRLSLSNLLQSLAPGGRLFINIPINSPAPDHIFMWTQPEQFEQLVREVGYTIDEVHLLPMTGYTVERALQMQASISCIVIARRPA